MPRPYLERGETEQYKGFTLSFYAVIDTDGWEDWYCDITMSVAGPHRLEMLGPRRTQQAVLLDAYEYVDQQRQVKR